MGDGLHSPMGPSSFERAEACTASAILAEGLEPVPTSDYTLEGNTAHWTMETCLAGGSDAWEMIGEIRTEGGEECVVDAEMADHLQPVLDYVRTLVGKADVLELEVRLAIPATQVFGTCDILLAKGRMPVHVCDLKYGAGVEVPADTVQAGLYGLMAIIREYGEGFLHEGAPDQVLVVVDILQPRSRVSKCKRWQWTRKALSALMGRVNRLVARVATRKLVFQVGEHCRFCSVIPVCPAMRQTAQDAAMSKVIAAPEMEFTGAELDMAFAMIPALNLYISRVAKMVGAYLEEGGQLQYAKLVQKKSNRAWKDEAVVKAWLSQHLDSPYKPQDLLSPAMAEKALPKHLRADVGTYAFKPDGGTTVAPADDPRPAIDTAARLRANEIARASARAMIEEATLKRGTNK